MSERHTSPAEDFDSWSAPLAELVSLIRRVAPADEDVVDARFVSPKACGHVRPLASTVSAAAFAKAAYALVMSGI